MDWFLVGISTFWGIASAGATAFYTLSLGKLIRYHHRAITLNVVESWNDYFINALVGTAASWLAFLALLFTAMYGTTDFTVAIRLTIIMLLPLLLLMGGYRLHGRVKNGGD